jgi:hypothetical protein
MEKSSLQKAAFNHRISELIAIKFLCTHTFNVIKALDGLLCYDSGNKAEHCKKR